MIEILFWVMIWIIFALDFLVLMVGNIFIMGDYIFFKICIIWCKIVFNKFNLILLNFLFWLYAFFLFFNSLLIIGKVMLGLIFKIFVLFIGFMEKILKFVGLGKFIKNLL